MSEVIWNAYNLEALLYKLADAAKDAEGKPIIHPAELLRLWEENRVHLLIEHGVLFSIECTECDGCGSGDNIGSLEQAEKEGWTKIETASGDFSESHFFGLCPEHSRGERMEP